MKRKNFFKNGVSLVEMLVAITILVLIMGGLTALLSRGWKVRSFVMEEGDVTKIAAAGIDSLSSDLRKVRYPCAGINNLYNPIQSGSDMMTMMMLLKERIIF
ncbi:MAG: hypothetical protein UR99_C0005G0022 [Candidatus Moranbacteria bacterium GW2011_GWD2_36_12]|nr:MAG: hypothetical protein UR99_C0005G0022 [Candidatus Moranbacteria bacterium GW2011_GWD2_36_12]